VEPDVLAAEARLFGRYLVGREPEPAVVERYVAANRTLFTEPLASEDAAALAFVQAHPWSVGMLDGASGLLRPGGALRSKILVMAAILETTPEHADEFLPRQVGPVALMVKVGAAGVRAVAEAIAGAVLLRTVARKRA
jgi:hypothetical protein